MYLSIQDQTRSCTNISDYRTIFIIAKCNRLYVHVQLKRYSIIITNFAATRFNDVEDTRFRARAINKL